MAVSGNVNITIEGGGTGGGSTAAPSGNSTLEIQQWLASHGYDPGPLDGIWGPKTKAALMQFQTDAGITVDGIVGPETLGAMNTWTGQSEGQSAGQSDPYADIGTPGNIPEGSNPGGTVSTDSPESTAPSGGGSGGSSGGSSDGSSSTEETDNTAAVPQMHILTGEKMTWYHDSKTGKWYVGYGLKSGRELIFEATDEQVAGIYGEGNLPVATETDINSLLTRSKVTFAGDIAEMEGEGSFEAEVSRITALALDEGVLPEWAKKDDAAMDIIFIAQSENKSTDWVLDQLSQLPSFEERFPGLNAFRKQTGLSLEEAVTGFLEMETGIKKALLSVGENPEVISPKVVGDLLSKGFSLKDVAYNVQQYERAKEFGPALQAFNGILMEKGLSPITSAQDVLDFTSGRSPKELYDIWEASSISEAAQQAGLGSLFTAEDALDIGLRTDQTLESATTAARKAAELLLRLRHEVDIGQFGLNSDDLIDISFGATPRSGASMAEIQDNINRAVKSAQAYIQGKRAEPYKGFTASGSIKSQSLAGLRQTS